MKIALFGGNGFIGNALQKSGAHDHDIVVFDLNTGDIRNPETFTRQLVSTNPDVVINLAAVLGTMTSAPSVLALYETNVMGNLKVLKASYEAGVRKYIFASSLTVHGENTINDHRTRSSPFNPKHGYSASKASAEFSMMQYLIEAPDMSIVTVRPTMVLGEGTYLPHAPIEFIRAILAGKHIEIYGEGRHEREWIWIDDVVDGILKATEYVTATQSGYHPFILSGNRIAMRNLAEMIAAKLEGKVVFMPSTTQAFTLTSDFAESQSLLKWMPKNTLDTMVEKLTAILFKR